jgi:hypothetical protein
LWNFVADEALLKWGGAREIQRTKAAIAVKYSVVVSGLPRRLSSIRVGERGALRQAEPWPDAPP